MFVTNLTRTYWTGRYMSELAVGALRCEHLVDPLGIDVGSPRLTWVLESARRGTSQAAYRLLVASSIERLAADEGDVWDSGPVETGATALVAYDGPPLASRQACHWKVKVWDDAGEESRWSAPALWEMGLLAPEDWAADWLTVIRPKPGEDGYALARYLRASFELPDVPVVRGRAYVTALGLYELHCNGAKVSDGCFRPGWTDYDKRVQYQVYDITASVRPGANAVGVILGDGWYAGDIGMGKREQWGSWTELLAQIEVELSDGTRRTIPTKTGWTIDKTDASLVVSPSAWRAAPGPILSNDLQQGETYDARLELHGWSMPGFDDHEWDPAFPGGGPVGRLAATCSQPVQAMEELVPRSVASPAPDTWVFDLGQNMVGWCRLRVRGEAGKTVTIRHAEMLKPDGTMYTENLRGAGNIDRYTLAGGTEEIWEPRFTFHGFRYVELTGFPGEPTLDAVTGIVAHSAAPRSGTFECSNPLVNQLYSNINWGQRGNFLEVPTDCPQRDERLGWMGDAQIFAATATLNMDVAAFFTKWLKDVRDAQLENGAYPDVCPRFGRGNASAAPAWGDAGVLVPWALYRRYGDLGLLEEHFESMAAWIDYLHRRNPDLLWQNVRGMDWGDWVAIDADTSKDAAATAWWANSTALLARAAELLGRTDDAHRYADLAEKIRRAFCAAHVHDDGTIESGTQTIYALALRFGLLEPALRAKAAANLVADIKERDGHLSTGFMGIAHLLPALTEAGELDVAYGLLLNETFPSWGYSIRHGATTIWERWNGWTEENGFEASGMNSFNHYAFGAVGEWIYETLGGVAVDHAAASTINIRPRPGGDITWATTTYESIYGSVGCSWTTSDDGLVIEARVPANASAEVWVPVGEGATVTEGAGPAEHAEGVEPLGRREDSLVFRVGSGQYRFAVSG